MPVKLTTLTQTPAEQVPPVGQIHTRVTKSPAQGERDCATSLPQTKTPLEPIPGRPIPQRGSEIGKITEISNPPNMKLPAVGEVQSRVPKSAPAEGECNRATSLLQAKALLESIPGRPIPQSGSENGKVTEISDPPITRLPAVEEIRARLTKSAPARARSKRAPGVSWETFSILLLVIALGFAVWGFYTRESNNRVEHPVSPSSNSDASISPPASVASSKETKAPSFEVLIKAHKNVRVLIKADGRRVAEETLTSGAERSVRAANQVIVKAGNLGALDFEFNGRELPSQGAYGEVKTLEFGPSGLEVIISNPRSRIKQGE